MAFGRFRSLGDNITDGITFLVQDDTFMVARGDLAKFIERVIPYNVTIIGFEGFTYDGEHITPDMDSIIDLGAQADVDAIRRGIEIAMQTKASFYEPVISGESGSIAMSAQ